MMHVHKIWSSQPKLNRGELLAGWIQSYLQTIRIEAVVYRLLPSRAIAIVSRILQPSPPKQTRELKSDRCNASPSHNGQNRTNANDPASGVFGQSSRQFPSLHQFKNQICKLGPTSVPAKLGHSLITKLNEIISDFWLRLKRRDGIGETLMIARSD